MRSKRYEYHGELLTVSEISARTGLSTRTIRRRIRDKIDFDADLTTPKKHPFGEEMLTLREIAKKVNLSHVTVVQRLAKGIALDAPYRNVKLADFHNKQMSAPEIAKIEGVSRQALYQRIKRGSAELGKVPRRRRRVFYKGAERSTHEIAELDGVHYQKAAKVVREIRKQNG
jgi:predicted DNA-binding protein YlxM (UPF0122 family)